MRLMHKMTETCEPMGKGFPVVLTADRTLMADYRALFGGMLSASQTTRTPALLMKHVLAPRVRSKTLRAEQAPLGLRRVEAALLADGWRPTDVAVVCPEDMSRAVGPQTRIIGISSGDPLGAGMNSSTMAGIAGGEIYTSRLFRDLTEGLKSLRSRAPGARTVMGGPGAWQLVSNGRAVRELGIDHVVTGYCEANAAGLFQMIAGCNGLPPVVEGIGAAAADIAPIRAATVMGSVEISRGCGLGCRFCTMARTPMEHLPAETILADIETNAAAGARTASLVTEDVFRYGASGTRVSPEALIGLLGRIRKVEGLAFIQADHANITSVAQFTDHELEELHRLFAGEARRHGYVWVNLGVETAAGELLAVNGGRGKMNPYSPREWGDVCMEQVRRLEKAGFFPLVSLMVGLPGETPSDVERTCRWVSQLRGARAAAFPLYYAPIDGLDQAFATGDMSSIHWRLFRECYRLNFRWLPRLCWDNQSVSGVNLWRRLLVQALGRVHVLWWKSLFAFRSGRLLS